MSECNQCGPKINTTVIQTIQNWSLSGSIRNQGWSFKHLLQNSFDYKFYNLCFTASLQNAKLAKLQTYAKLKVEQLCPSKNSEKLYIFMT